MPTVSFPSDPNKPEEIQQLEVSLNETIFDECEKKGANLPHGCLAGSCGSCRIEIAKGTEFLNKPSPIEQDTIEAIKVEIPEKQDKEIRLSCRARIIKEGEVSFKPFK